MLLIVGLGNPDKKYQFNRHNVGFMAVDAISERLGVEQSEFKEKHGGLLAQAVFEGQKILFFKPQSYMNKSGIPVSRIKTFYKIDLDNIIVIHDELDFTFAKLRYKLGGGAGGHNGLRSLDSLIGKDYHRVRVGIDKPPFKEMVSSHVLSDFDKDEQPEIDFLLNKLAKNTDLLVTKQFELLITRIVA